MTEQEHRLAGIARRTLDDVATAFMYAGLCCGLVVAAELARNDRGVYVASGLAVAAWLHAWRVYRKARRAVGGRERPGFPVRAADAAHFTARRAERRRTIAHE